MRFSPSPEEKTELLRIGAECDHNVADLMEIVKPATYRRWVGQSKKGQPFKQLGRPRLTQELRDATILMAKENILWGYRRIAGELKKLGLYAGATTVKRILQEVDIHPTPEKEKKKPPIPWLTFLKAHLESVVACDFFTKDVFTPMGKMTAYALVFIHRSHPLVATLADYVAERALDEEEPELAARCGAIFTREVTTRTTVFLLRLRSQLIIERREGNSYAHEKTLLSEECLGVAVEGSGAPRILPEQDALALMQLQPARNMEPGQQTQMIETAKQGVEKLQLDFSRIARLRADELLADHRRVREASDARGVRYDVRACLPVDVIGLYVLAPVVSF